jgi:hypothetical protein
MAILSSTTSGKNREFLTVEGSSELRCGAADASWHGQFERTVPEGSVRPEFTAAAIDKDTAKFEVSEQMVSGDAKPFPAVSIWRRNM